MLQSFDPKWVPLYVAALAAMVAFIVAFINAWSARCLDVNRAYREYRINEAKGGLVHLDDWHTKYIQLVREDSRANLLQFLRATEDTEEARVAWATLLTVGDFGWRTKKKYKRFVRARRSHAEYLEELVTRPREENVNPRLAFLNAEVSLYEESGRGFIRVIRTWNDFRYSLVRNLFRTPLRNTVGRFINAIRG